MTTISESTIRHHATDLSFNRGEEYYEQGAVIELVQRGNTIAAQVEGSEVTPYQVSFQIDSGGITAVRCTCLYDYGGWCKHIVAAALTWVRHPNCLEVRPTLSQLLDGLNLAQMQQLVQALVAHQPELVDAIERQVLLLSNSALPTKGAKSRRRSVLDVAPFKRQVTSILREGIRYLEEGGEDDPFTDSLLPVIEKALEFADHEDGKSAIAILSAITESCVDEWDNLCDYGGDGFEIAESLDEAWTTAILSAALDPTETVDLQGMLADCQDVFNTDFSMSLAALQQGWDDPELQRALQGEGYSDPERLETPFGQSLALIRLQILERRGQQQEYLHLARTEGLMVQYLTRLAELGKLDEAMAAAREGMTTAEEALSLAKTLREQNHPVEALTIARAGLPLLGRCRYDLASWASELAEGLGDRETALNASIIACQLQPSLAEYQRVRHFAGDQWGEFQPDLLDTLRQSQEWQAQEAKVDIFLSENLIEDAIAAVRSNRYYRSELVHRVMQAAMTTHPDWVMQTAHSLAEPIMNQGKADRYQEAVRWLQQAKMAYVQAERQSEWMAYFNQLQSVHARKRKLMDLFKQLR